MMALEGLALNVISAGLTIDPVEVIAMAKSDVMEAPEFGEQAVHIEAAFASSITAPSGVL